MKFKLIVISIFLTLFVSGCSFIGFDIQELMRPPRPVGDEAEIQKVIESSTNGYTFKYPQRGNYKSAVIMKDIDGDGKDEAIAFYNTKNSQQNENMNIMIIDQDEEGWHKNSSFSNLATNVDKVCFGKLKNDNTMAIIVGWNGYNGMESRITVFKYIDGEVKALDLDYNYYDFVVEDFDADGLCEIFLIGPSSKDNKDKISSCILIKNSEQSGKLHNVGQIELNCEFLGCSNIKYGYIFEGQLGVVIDGEKAGNKKMTQLIYWNKEKSILSAPLYQSELDTLNQRNTNIFSCDINNDGIIEIPINVPMMGYLSDNLSDIATKEDESYSYDMCYITQWNQYNLSLNKYIYVSDTVFNYEEGYYFEIPKTWENSVTALIDKEDRSLTFSEWVINDDGVGAVGAAILKIKTLTQTEWDKLSNEINDFYKICELDGIVYVAQIPEENFEYSLNINQVIEGFNILKNCD